MCFGASHSSYQYRRNCLRVPQGTLPGELPAHDHVVDRFIEGLAFGGADAEAEGVPAGLPGITDAVDVRGKGTDGVFVIEGDGHGIAVSDFIPVAVVVFVGGPGLGGVFEVAGGSAGCTGSRDGYITQTSSVTHRGGRVVLPVERFGAGKDFESSAHIVGRVCGEGE